MAITNIHSIRTTLCQSIQYIIDGNKTRNGELVTCSGCVSDAQGAADQFNSIRACGTGRSTILAQHIIQSFAPGEITPENAHRVGLELCEKLLGNEYQYIVATHCDHAHVHNHIIFNNTNMITHKTFETEHNKGKKSWLKLREMSDELCRLHCLSVIEDSEKFKGKSYYEWEMDRQGVSWKSKLKYAIDQVVKESEDFEDFLRLCKNHGIEVVYNPDHKIDLKFRLDGQQKFTRSRTLGWYYETPQIKKRIQMYKKAMNYSSDLKKLKIIAVDTEKMQASSGLQRWADIQNMKNASKIINILTQYDVKDNEDLKNKCLVGMMSRGAIVGKLEPMQKEIELLKEKRKAVATVKKYETVIAEKRSLKGRKQKKYVSEHYSEIQEFNSAFAQLKEWYPEKMFPSEDVLDRIISEKTAEFDNLNQQYNEVAVRNKDLEYCRQQLEEYIRMEQSRTQQKKKKQQLE